MNAFRLALLLLPLLFGCASTDYKRYVADDSVLLRVSQSGFRTIYGNFTTNSTAGNRQQTFFTDAVYDYGDAVTLKSQSRENMLGSPPAERMNVVEMSVRPGRYSVTFFQNLLDERQCKLQSIIDLEANEQYWIDLNNAICTVTLSRVERIDGELRWQVQFDPTSN